MDKEDLYMKGMELFSDDRLDDAIVELNKAIQMDEKFGDALHALAMTYYHKGELSEAIRYGEKFRVAEPDNVHAYTSLSMFYNAKGFIEKAEEMAALAARLGPQD